MARFQPNMRLRDRYELREPIGEGGMAVVWAGHDLTLDRPVAIKEISSDQQAGWWPGALAEAKAAARLAHPNITAVHDYGELTWPDGATTAYLVMELVRGHPLADRLAGGPLPWPTAAAIGAQVASALAAAHAHGLVHRDVKPANIMLTPTGVKLLDFGIAGNAGGDQRGPLMGTPAYAAPEQLRNSQPGPAADVYALAVTIVEMVLGHRPWQATTWEEAREQHTRPRAVPPLPGVPHPAAAGLAACLHPDPQRRPTAADLANLLNGFPRWPSGVAPVSAVSPVRTPPAPTRIDQSLSPPAGRRRLLVPALVFAVLLGIGAYAVLDDETPGSTAATGSAAPTGPTTPAIKPSPSIGSASTSPPSPSNDQVPALLAALQRELASAIRSGKVDPERVDELRDDAVELAKRWWAGKKKRNFAEKCQDLRDNLAEAAAAGEINATAAQILDDLLARLIAAAS